MSATVAPASNVMLRWLLRLRWWAVVGQLAAIAAAWLPLRLAPPLVALGLVVAITAATNLVLQRGLVSGREVSRRLLASVLALDTLSLTLLLASSGGTHNPFVALYLVHVTLAAVVLGRRGTWLVLGLSAACLLALSLMPVALPVSSAPSPVISGGGVLLAFLAAGAMIAWFVSRLQEDLARRENALSLLQSQAARHEKLASLTTLAAGAAHELSTPLGTIAVVAKELERGVDELDRTALRGDLKLIREEVERCRLILVQMSATAGEAAGELPGAIPVPSLIADVRAALAPERATRLEVEVAGELASVEAPRQALTHVLTSLARNGFDASAAGSTVRLVLGRGEGRIRFSVEDRGAGMSREILARAGDPFFTTKPAGQGTGLGLFIARAFAQRLGGRLVLSSEPGTGTLAEIELPQPLGGTA